MDLMVLGYQFDMYIIDLHNDDDFFGIKGIASLAEKMVKTKNDSLERVFQIGIYTYKSVFTSPNCNCYSEESFFFPAMHIIKSRLWNMMRYKWINNSLVVYIEKNIFDDINNEVIMK
jgi:hypothetical protein